MAYEAKLAKVEVNKFNVSRKDKCLNNQGKFMAVKFECLMEQNDQNLNIHSDYYNELFCA